MVALSKIEIFFITNYIPNLDNKGNIIFKNQYERNVYNEAYRAKEYANEQKMFLSKTSVRVTPVINDAQRLWVQKNWGYSITGYPLMMFADFYDDNVSYTPLSIIWGSDMNFDKIYQILDYFSKLKKQKQASGKNKYFKKEEGALKEWKPLKDAPETKKEGNNNNKPGPNGKQDGGREGGPDGGKEGGEKEGNPYFGRNKIPIIDDLLDKVLDLIKVPNDIKSMMYFVGAAAAAYKTIESEKTVSQIGFGALASYLALKGLEVNETSKPKKNSIGKIAKSKFVQVYKDRGFKELGWKPITNIRFAQGKAGVYLIKRNGILIYIGAGANVYKTALRHFEPHPADGQNKQNYHDDYDFNDYTIRIVLTGTRERAAKLESALIRKHRPRDNKFIPDEELELTPQQRKVLNQYNEAEAQSPIYLEEAPF